MSLRRGRQNLQVTEGGAVCFEDEIYCKEQ